MRKCNRPELHKNETKFSGIPCHLHEPGPMTATEASMTHSHPLPDATALCPYCATDPGLCCRMIQTIRAKRRRKDRAHYARNPEKERARRLRSYHNRKTKPPTEPDPT